MLDYSIVIATRNRPAALRLSIPRMLSQSRPPAQLIIIDSSDDHDATKRAVVEAVGSNKVEWIIRHTEPSSSAQRNLGLEFVDHPLVFFPDDDSIWFPGTAELQVKVYEQDVDKRIAAVCGGESPVPPDDWEIKSTGSYQMRKSDRLRQRFAGRRAKLQNHFFPDPTKVLGRRFWPEEGEVPGWFAENDVVFVEYMTGFRMSFRTEVIRKFGFDETLNRYALCEDIDASFGAWLEGWVVAAKGARVYHYKSPENRANPAPMGVIQILNKSYIVLKRAGAEDQVRKVLWNFMKSKVLMSRLVSGSSFDRAKLQGMKAGLEQLPRLLSCDPRSLDQAYRAGLKDALVEVGANY